MARQSTKAQEEQENRGVNCSPEEFFRRIREAEDPSGLIVYVYRLWPVIDRSLAGVDYKHILATPPPFTLDHLVKQCGSGKYRLILCDENLGKRSRIAQTMVSINDPDWPPVVNPKELILEHPDNRGYVESLRMRGLLEDQAQGAPADTAAAVAVESLSRTVQDLANRVAERPREDSSDRAFSLALRLAELLRPGKDPYELATQIAQLAKSGNDQAILLKTLLEQQTRLTELLVQQRANPLGELEQFERLLKLAERLTGKGGGGESWGLELVRSLPATLAAAADLARTVAAAKAGQAVSSAPGAPIAPPGPATVPAPTGNQVSMDRLIQVGQRAVVAFQKGATGDEFAHSLVMTEPDGEAIYEQLCSLGKAGIMGALRSLPVWSELEPRTAQIEQFVDAFLQYGEDEAA